MPPGRNREPFSIPSPFPSFYTLQKKQQQQKKLYHSGIPPSPWHLELGLLRVPAAQFWQQGGFPGACSRYGVCSWWRMETASHALPLAVLCWPLGPLGLESSRFCAGLLPPHRAGPPRTLLCSRSFAPAQASAGTDTYLKKSSHKPLLHSAKPWLFCLHCCPLGTF